MKILLISIGTRGDIEPFLATGEILNRKGHEVIFAFPEQYADLIPEGFKFYPLSPKFVELIESKEGKIIMGAKVGIFIKLKAIWTLYKKSAEINKDLVKQQYDIIEKEKPDKIFHNVKCSYPLLWGKKYHKETILFSPVPYSMYYVKGNAHIGFNGNFGTLINKLTYRLSNFGLIKIIKAAQKSVPDKYSYTRSEIREELFNKKLIYTISPSLFKRPETWPSNVQVLGYHERSKTVDWRPDEKLLNFLSQQEKVLFLTFGSMVNHNPVETSKIIYTVLNELRIPTVINIASGGLIELEEFRENSNFIFVNQIPYDWVLEKVYAIIHHGGSGTTHSGLKYGCASLIIPHIIDQFGWNNLIQKLGAGPKGISVNKLTAKKLKPLISDLMNNTKYKSIARKRAEKMNNENLSSELLEFIT